MLKRYTAMILAALLAALTLTACGAKQEAAPAPAPAAQAAAPAPAQVDEAKIVEAAVAKFFKTIPQNLNVIPPEKLKENLDAGQKYFILDIRKPEDFAKGHIAGATNIYFSDVYKHFNELPKDKPIVVICYTGHTASQTTAALKVLGFNAMVMKFGMTGWDKANFPKVQ